MPEFRQNNSYIFLAITGKLTDTNSPSTALEIEFLDIAIDHNQTSPIHFTFFGTISQNWENRNNQVAVVS